MNTTVHTTANIVNLEAWKAKLPELKAQYQTEHPYPHISIDNFLEEWAAEKAMQSFPAIQDEGWIHYVHVNEKKHGLNKMELLPPFIQEVITYLNSDAFVAFMSELTGIPNLKADDMLEGGGLHQSKRGGFLNVHADFTVHPHKRNWRRRVNLLLYLNKDWKPEYRGDLELWDRKMTGVEAKIAPIFNRIAVFNTDDDSFHGLPDPIQCPEDMTRKSVALYYFTEEKETPKLRPTNYQARPGDGIKSVAIWLDKQAVATYTRLKRTLGIDDKMVSKVLNIFGGKKK
ncbi:2OG-Fe(II) oxygenase [Siphonobacter sp.]|uniref:2OG-Fe(II) oxygenase n=1 Tax=Siphonobacter sp. TaxID=1869184 RepID=UPI003B3B00C7